MFPSARHLCMIYKHPSRGQERLYVVSVDVPFRAVAPSSSSPHFFFGCPGDLAPFASNLFHRSEISSTPSVCSKLSPSFSPHDHPSVVSASRFTQPKFPARITSPSYYVSRSATRFRVAAQSRPQVWRMCGCAVSPTSRFRARLAHVWCARRAPRHLSDTRTERASTCTTCLQFLASIHLSDLRLRLPWGAAV